jgi:hypothetical protein
MATQIKTILSHEVLSGHPASPAAGFIHIYALSDGFYQKDSSGAIAKLSPAADEVTQGKLQAALSGANMV